MKVIVIGGYPGSGKSTIMRKIIRELETQGYKFRDNHKGIISWMESKELILLGSYAPDETFPGTDRFPLNVQPEAQKFILESFSKKQDRVIIFEGDRLFNGKMIAFLKDLKGVELVMCVVLTDRHLLESRRNERSEQSSTWRKGRETKVDRIATIYPIHHYLKNNTKEEQEASVQELLSEIKGEWKSKTVESKIKSYWS